MIHNKEVVSGLTALHLIEVVSALPPCTDFSPWL